MDPDALFQLRGATPRDPAVAAWFAAADPLRVMTAPWFGLLETGDPRIGALIHDGRPTLCLQDAAFAYVDAFTAHAAIGFFHGASLPDPDGLLEGKGVRMRHVKIRPGAPLNEPALKRLIARARADIISRVEAQAHAQGRADCLP